jgi:serine/threonine protein phosphatase PrpC
MISTPRSDLNIGYASDPGRKRSSEPNQDSVLVIQAEQDHPPLFMVADGMGGHAGGAEASQLVVAAVGSRFRRSGRIDDLPAVLRECLQFAIDTLVDHVAGHPDLASMGSTAVIAVPQGGQIVIANVGDSRAYRLRYTSLPVAIPPPAPRRSRFFNWFRRKDPTGVEEESQVEVTQLSYDHSVVADLVRAGQLTPLQALTSPQRNRLTQSITPRRLDLVPYVNQYPFGAGDTILLCSDGLWGVVPEATVAAIAMEFAPQLAANKLVQQAINYGGPDNISVIIVRANGEQTRSLDDDATLPGR